MFCILLTIFTLLASSKLSLSAPNSPTSSAAPTAVPIPTFVCFPPGDPLSEIFTIEEIGGIVGATGVSECPPGVACDAPSTEELELINNSLQSDPDLDFIVALLRDEEPGVALIGVCT